MSTFITLGAFAFVFPAAVLLWMIYRFLIKIYIDAYRYKKMDPTLAVFTYPIAGLLRIQKQCLEKYGDSHWFVKNMVKQNPDQLAYLTNLGDKSFLVITDSALVKEMCIDHKSYQKFKPFKHMDICYLRGIFFAEGNDWKIQKELIAPAFNYDHLKRMIPIMMSTAREAMVRRKALIPQNDVMEVLYQTQTIIGEILARTFFSNDITQKQVNGRNLSLALADFSSFNFYRSRAGLNILMIMLFGEKARMINFTSGDRKLLKTIQEIREVVFEIIDERIAGKGQEQEDFMKIYITEMKKRDEQYQKALEAGEDVTKISRVTKEEMLHQLLSFYFAGIDTTGHLLSFALYCCAEYPHYYQKLEDEINTFIKTEADITYENITKLDYIDKFVRECLRMWPPAVGILTRVVTRDVQLGPFALKKGSNVGTNIIGLMHNPKYYKDPSVFNPERWSDKDSLSADSYSYIPFSAGPRSCIGKHLAMLETKIILIYYLKFFTLKRTDVQLRIHCKFLSEPVDDKLVRIAPKQQNNWT